MTGHCKQCGMRIHDPNNCSTRYMYDDNKRHMANIRFQRQLCVGCYKKLPKSLRDRHKELVSEWVKKQQ